MSTRQEDINDLNERLETLAKKRQEVFEEYQKESVVLNEKAKEMLTEAGLLEQWTELESDKATLNKKYQDLLDPYNNAIKQLVGVRSWLSSKEAPVSEPAVSEETEALEASISEEKEEE